MPLLTTLALPAMEMPRLLRLRERAWRECLSRSAVPVLRA